MSELSLVILKPDAVSRWITWKIIDRFEIKGLKLIANKMSRLDEWLLKDHYAHLADKPFFSDILNYMTSAPVILQVWGWNNVVEVIRKLVWATNPLEANPWTVRHDFAINIDKNLIHASDSIENAKIEINRFFEENEINYYNRVDESMVY